MSTLGKIEWACQDIGSSHPLPYRSGGAYQNGNLVRTKIIMEMFCKEFFHERDTYYLMQQGGVISFADSESFLVSYCEYISGLNND
jgi:hypothetical protein